MRQTLGLITSYLTRYDMTSPSVCLIVVAAKDVVRRLLCVDPAERISLEELLHHPWFSVGIELFLVALVSKCAFSVLIDH